MKYLSLFSGIGTGEKGIEQAYQTIGLCGQPDSGESLANAPLRPEHERHSSSGYGSENPACPCVGYAEIDKYANAVYRYHWPDARNFGDATAIVCDELPDFDFLIAGFPCQAFSIAGKRQGFNEARGTLFFEIARILSHKRPGHFLLENVGGLRSHDGGKTMQRIFRVLADLGYFVEVPLLNSKDYGVPQNRERVFFIGHLAERCEREILSVGDGDREVVSQGYERAISGTISTKNQSGQCNFDGSTALIPGKDGKGMDLVTVNVYADHSEPTDLAMTLKARHDGSISERNGKTMVAAGVNYPSRGGEVRTDGLASALKAGYGMSGQKPLAQLNGERIRRLTPIECERLQGLPDDFTKYGLFGDKVIEISDTQRYKTTGNAMTVNVIEAIVGRMIEKGCLG